MTTLSNILPFPGAGKDATYLVLISPESVPHLGLIHGGLYYSLTYKECEIGKDFAIYLQSLVRSKRKLLFIEVTGVADNPWSVFKKYERLVENKLTCLAPIKETLLGHSDAEFVFELVPELLAKEKIRQIYHLNMEAELKKDHSFKLREYDKATIYAYIKALNERDAKRT